MVFSLEGRRIGRYQIRERLGQGGMGAVFSARAEDQDHDVAIKLLFGPFTSDPEFLARMRREAQVIASLEHPRIVRLLEYREEPEVGPCLVMERALGEDLRRLLDREAPLAIPLALNLGAQVAEALAHAHQRGVIHRDIKPENLVVDDAGRVVVTDFGIARAAGGSRVTRTGFMPGTPDYMAPEQLGPGQIGPATDLYALGMVVFEMLTGRTPFRSEHVGEVIHRQIFQTPVPPSMLRPEISREIDLVVLSCLAKTPEQRPPSAQALAAELTRLAQVPIPPMAAPSPQPPGQTGRPPSAEPPPPPPAPSGRPSPAPEPTARPEPPPARRPPPPPPRSQGLALPPAAPPARRPPPAASGPDGPPSPSTRLPALYVVPTPEAGLPAATSPTVQVALREEAPSPVGPLRLLPLLLLGLALVFLTLALTRTPPVPSWYQDGTGFEPAPLERILAGAATLHGAEFALFAPDRSSSGLERARATSNALASLLRGGGLEGLQGLKQDGEWTISSRGGTLLVRVDRNTAAHLGADPEELGRWWMALLEDHLALREGREPDKTLDFERAHPLRRSGSRPVAPLFDRVYRRARHQVPEGRLPTGAMLQAIQSLDAEESRAFREAARELPRALPSGVGR